MKAKDAKEYAVAEVAHDLNTHLSALRGFLKLLENTELDLFQTDCVSTALDCAQDLKRSLDRIVEDAREDFEPVAESHIKEVDLASELNGTVLRFLPLAAAKSLRLNSHAKPASIRAKVDWEKLQRILINLLSNSIKFTQNGGVRVELTATETSSRDLARAFRLDVIDSGIGMAEEEIAVAFHPFRQLRRATNQEGVGLGLAVVRRLVREMDGELTVSSQLNRGTTITIEAPLVG